MSAEGTAVVLEVTINGERYVSESRLVEALARLYNEGSPTRLAVARLCDESLDRRGALLGKVREAASRL